MKKSVIAVVMMLALLGMGIYGCKCAFDAMAYMEEARADCIEAMQE